VFPDVARVHVALAKSSVISESLNLKGAGPAHTLADGRRWLGRRSSLARSLNFTAGTSRWMSIRSSSGPEMRAVVTDARGSAFCSRGGVAENPHGGMRRPPAELRGERERHSSEMVTPATSQWAA
jgi:hypothetical protein